MADVTIEHIAASAEHAAFVRVGGIFYNTQAATPDDFTGDVFAAVYLGDRGDGLEAFMFVVESINADFSDGGHRLQCLSSLMPVG